MLTSFFVNVVPVHSIFVVPLHNIFVVLLHSIFVVILAIFVSIMVRLRGSILSEEHLEQYKTLFFWTIVCSLNLYIYIYITIIT